jgi:hypothetical protein
VDQGFEIAHFATKDADGGGEAGGENFPPCKALKTHKTAKNLEFAGTGR